MSKKRVAVVMPARNEFESFRSGFLEKILRDIPPAYDPTIMVIIGDSLPKFIRLAQKISEKNKKIRIFPLKHTNNMSTAYLWGLQQAVDSNFDYIVEMDATGAHDSSDLPRFLNALDHGYDVVFSSRFVPGGGIANYPWQRKLISKTGTLLANAFLNLGQNISDMTSGYEAFKSHVLSSLFKKKNINQWICHNFGPGHFYQTEIRTYILWMKYKVSILPIVWGANKKDKVTLLKFSTLWRAFSALFLLRKEYNSFTQND